MKLKNISDAGVRLEDLNAEDRELIIKGLDTELGTQRRKEKLQKVGL